jgi:hypothetical protein
MTLTNTVPVVRINQQFAHIPSELTENLLAMCIAPHYYICRYSDSSEKAKGAFGTYNGGAVTAAWPNRPAGGVVDAESVRVFIDNALLRYFNDPLDDASFVQMGSANNRLVASDLVFRTANGVDRSAAFLDRDVKVGDPIRIRTAGGDDFWTTVAGFDYEEVDAELEAVGGDDNNQEALTLSASRTASGFTGCVTSVSAAAYDGLADGFPEETYVLTCTSAMVGTDPTTATFKLVSASGTDDDASVTLSASGVATNIGSRGATLTVTTSSGDTIAVGDSITMTFKQVYDTVTFAVKPTAIYTGTVDRRYVITVTGLNGADPIVVARSTTGDDVDGPKTITLGTYTAIGSYGVQIRFTAGSNGNAPCPGDKYYLDATAATEGACNELILARGLPDDIVEDVDSGLLSSSLAGGTAADLDISLYIKKNIEVTKYSAYPTTNFTPGELTLTLNAALTSTDSSWTSDGELQDLPIVGGSVFVQYRALLTTYANGRSELSDADEVTSTLGPAIADNPLSLMVYSALLNSGGQPVGFISLESGDTSEELDSYNEALGKIRDDIRCYGITVGTQNADVLDAVKAHVLAQSSSDRKRFRVAFLSAASAEVVLVTDTGDDDENLTARVRLHTDTGTNIRITSAHGNFITDGVRAGDEVRLNYAYDDFGVETYDSYVVDSVVSEDELLLVSGPAAATSVEDKLEIWRAWTATEEATAFAGKSSAFNDRRIRNIWPPEIETSDGTTVPGWAACAALAGLRSGAAPHQPLSNAELNGFASVSRTTTRMRESDLDIMANGGTWILTQEPTGGKVYTRLAITTDVSDANHWQDCRTTNCDSISFGYNNRLKGIVGKTNITERTLTFIANEFNATSQYFMSEARTPELGPQLISATLTTPPTQNAVLRDSVDMVATLELPYELDAINLTLNVQ